MNKAEARVERASVFHSERARPALFPLQTVLVPPAFQKAARSF